MTACDFGRSFATFVTEGRGNNARIQVEAICDLVGPAGETRYVLVASCKAENTYAADDLFRLPNYDFCALFSDTEYCIIRAGLPLTAAWRDSGLNADRFEEVRIDLVEAPARVCADAREVVEATLRNEPLIGLTELLGDGGELRARLHYPIKTMNVNDVQWIYQIDTGPLALPEFRRHAELEVERLDLAFIAWSSRSELPREARRASAWNAADAAEFIIQRPTQIAHSDSCVAHYREVRKVAARNEVLALI